MIDLLFEWQHSLWLLLAVIVEIIANVLLKLSNGFEKKAYGILSLIAVLAAFSALGQAVKGIDLAVAYALWGGMGLLATITFGWILFGQRLNWIGGVGIILLLIGMTIIKLA
ncbi:multidrug/spermidine efflux SMR transporter subunit MdtI [Rosenbergiella sp. S61]|uniref:Spermidine export protein MdtI n=1 Tax=Rosenbergiella gaditana TaxID=2726987 RepID=A0ABS5SXY5_9GAMM|nr:multidrug/spermidine efflux SMR transporter subunit MdtI [Rosenbergiella gaditana]MBT0724966.1 multidrug/spermidine efflux SMR transporter subunit MdtI [Rosenbergiella gaditana]